jgi:hypothetical protein
VAAALSFFAASGELRRGGRRGDWYKVEASLLWMLVHAGQREGAPPGLKHIAYRVLYYMIAMKRCGRRVKMDDAHGNVSTSCF